MYPDKPTGTGFLDDVPLLSWLNEKLEAK